MQDEARVRGAARQSCLFPAVLEKAAAAALASLTCHEHGRRRLSSCSRLLLSLFTPILAVPGVTITCPVSPCTAVLGARLAAWVPWPRGLAALVGVQL